MGQLGQTVGRGGVAGFTNNTTYSFKSTFVFYTALIFLVAVPIWQLFTRFAKRNEFRVSLK
jgi:hypothetical protein